MRPLTRREMQETLEHLRDHPFEPRGWQWAGPAPRYDDEDAGSTTIRRHQLMFSSPDAGPFTTLVVVFLSGVLDLLTAFNVFHASDAQKTAVIAVTTAAIALGLYVWAFLHQQALKLKAQYPALYGPAARATRLRG